MKKIAKVKALSNGGYAVIVLDRFLIPPDGSSSRVIDYELYAIGMATKWNEAYEEWLKKQEASANATT